LKWVSRITSSRHTYTCTLCLLLLLLAADAKSVAQQLPNPPENSPQPATTFGREDLNALAVLPGSLHPAAPILGERDTYPEFTRELWQVQWRNNDPIDLYVIRPQGVPAPPAVIYLYSYPAESDRFLDNEYCKRITSGGFAAIGFVSALTGGRYHDRPMKEWFVSQLPEALVESVHDVQMVLSYLESRTDIDASRVGIFSQGSGATIALLTSTVDPRLRAVDALQPWGDWPVWLAHSSLVPEAERTTYLKPEFLNAIAAYAPVRALANVKTPHLQVQFVMDEKVTVAEAAKAIKAAVPSTAAAVEYQNKLQQYMALSNGRAFDWVKDHLAQSTPHKEKASSN
jgi:hypothetical protein